MNQPRAQLVTAEPWRCRVRIAVDSQGRRVAWCTIIGGCSPLSLCEPGNSGAGELTDGELAGVIGDDDRVTQKLVRVDATRQRALGGDLDRVGSNG